MVPSYYSNNFNSVGSNQAGNYYGANYSNFGYPSAPRTNGYGYNEGPPIIGPMQGGGYGQNGYGPSDSPTDLRMASLLNIAPLQNMVNRETGTQASNSQDNTDPLSYEKSRLQPILFGAEKTYHEAGGTSAQSNNDQSQSSSSKSSTTYKNAPSSVPLDSSSGS